MDFTLATYRFLIKTLKDSGYAFQTYAGFLEKPGEKVVILRHDVDKRPENSLATAFIERENDISGTYYFRAVPQSWNEEIIKEIASLGHEIGYHYEDLTAVAKRKKEKGERKKEKGESKKEKVKSKKENVSETELSEPELLNNKTLQDHKPQAKRRTPHTSALCTDEYLVAAAIGRFCENLQNLRKIAPVRTICMHGSPLSRWDNRLLWDYYNYKDYGISGEPYFDTDFTKVLYLTDTGRQWDGGRYSIRDRVKTEDGRPKREDREVAVSLHLHTTSDIIRALQSERLPQQIMFTIHPQRWTDNKVLWLSELIGQRVKNGVKYLMKTVIGNRSCRARPQDF